MSYPTCPYGAAPSSLVIISSLNQKGEGQGGLKARREPRGGGKEGGPGHILRLAGRWGGRPANRYVSWLLNSATSGSACRGQHQYHCPAWPCKAPAAAKLASAAGWAA